MQKDMTQEEIMLGNAAFGSKLNVIHHAYVDIAGDLLAGALLSQILYWFGADRNGRPRARIRKDGHLWIAKSRSDWWEEIRISPKQYDRAAKILQGKGYIELRTMKFNGNPTTHIRIISEQLNKAIDEWKRQQAALVMAREAANRAAVGYYPMGNNEMHHSATTMLTNGGYSYDPIGNMEVTQIGTTLTEITTETKKEITAESTHTQKKGACEPLAFDFIWSQYPKKIGRSKAQRAFDEAVSKGTNPYLVLVEVVLFAQYISSEQESGGIEWRYVPTGGVWFDEQRWNDDAQLITKKLDYLAGVDYMRNVSTMRKLAKAAHDLTDMSEKESALNEIKDLIAQMPYYMG